MKKKIIIRCDGAAISKIGTGHVVRAISLAKVLIKQKICLSEEIIFVTQRQGLFKIGYNLIKDAGFYIEPNKKNNLKWNSVSEASFLSNLHADILILDRLSTSHKFMLTLKKKFKYLVSFDDTGLGSRVADVVINGILHKLPKRDSLYQGYKYLFLNNINHKKKKISKKVKNVVVSFGGHDERNLLGFYLDILRKNELFDNKKFKIDLLVGNKDDVNLRYWKKQIKFLNKHKKINISLFVRTENYFKILLKADIAILSGGLTIFNAIYGGVPSIAIPQYQHQLKTLKKLKSYKAIKMGSENIILNEKKFLYETNLLINSYNERLKLSNNAKNLIDGKGSKRVVKIIKSLLKKL